MKGEVLLPEKYLEIGLTPDGREIVINYPIEVWEPGSGMGHLVFSPDQARRFAALLLRKAHECSRSDSNNLSIGPALDRGDEHE